MFEVDRRTDGNHSAGMKVDRYRNHNIEVVIDKLAVKSEGRRTDSARVWP